MAMQPGRRGAPAAGPSLENGNMHQAQGASGLGMHVVDGVLMVQAPEDFDDAAFRALQRSVLDKVHSLSVRGVLIDVSTIRMIDSVGYGLLADTARTVALLGARAVFVGFQPGVVSALMDLDVACEDLLAARDLAHGMDLVRPKTRPAEEEEPQEPGEGQEDREAAESQASDLDAAPRDQDAGADDAAPADQDEHEPE
jgi:rsbT antagonist protein RsbS